MAKKDIFTNGKFNETSLNALIDEEFQQHKNEEVRDKMKTAAKSCLEAC
jgi:hypothetical protein